MENLSEKCDVKRHRHTFRTVCYQPWRIEYFGESKSGRLKANFHPLISQASRYQSPLEQKGIVNNTVA